MRVQAKRQAVLDALPGTQAEIAAKAKVGLATVCRWLVDIVETGGAHIGGWRPHPNGGPVSAVYEPGRGKTPKKPKALTDTERVRAYRKRQRKTGEWEDRKAQQRSRHWQTKPVTPSTDALHRAFF